MMIVCSTTHVPLCVSHACSKCRGGGGGGGAIANGMEGAEMQAHGTLDAIEHIQCSDVFSIAGDYSYGGVWGHAPPGKI